MPVNSRKQNWKYKTVRIFVCAKRSRYLKQTLRVEGRRGRSRYFKSLTAAFSRTEDNFFSLNTVSAPMRMQCSGARVWRTMNPLYGSLGRVEISFWLFCFCILGSGARWSEVTGAWARKIWQSASERAAPSFMADEARGVVLPLHGKIKSNRFHWRDTILRVVVGTCMIWTRDRTSSPYLYGWRLPSGYILTFVFLSPFFSCLRQRRWVMVSRSITKSKTYFSCKITAREPVSSTEIWT